MAERQVWIGGSLMPESQARVSIFDRGFVYGDAAYDALRTYRHQPLRLAEYIERFFKSLHYLGIDPGVTRDELADIARRVLAANLSTIGENEDLQIVMRCTRGGNYQTDALMPGPATLIVQTPAFRIDAASYDDGVDLLVTSIRRVPAVAVSPKPKTHDRLNNVLADIEARRRDPKARSLMLDTEGRVCEGSSYNIAAVVDGAIVTPKDNCLEGLAMKLVVELATKIGIPARYDDLTLFDLYNASEAFITGTSNGMLPVRSVDGRRVGSAIPGLVQERIWPEWDGFVGLDTREQARRYLNAAGPRPELQPAR
jgi:branched-chain amino acid aminotransferase